MGKNKNKNNPPQRQDKTYISLSDLGKKDGDAPIQQNKPKQAPAGPVEFKLSPQTYGQRQGNANNNNRPQQGGRQNTAPAQPVARPAPAGGSFINPYTFIPISTAVPDRKPLEKGTKTGVIACSLDILSPTFIPNTTHRFPTEVPKHYSSEFYSYEDLSESKKRGAPENPVVPGSEIRGMVRNVYEQLTNSCLLEIDENNLPYKRTPQPKEPAVLKYNKEESKWYLYLNPDYKKVEITQIRDKKLWQGEKLDIVYDRDNQRNIATKNTNGKYTLHLTGEIHGKEHQVAFNSNVTGNGIPMDEKVIERLTNVIISYCDRRVNKAGGIQYYEKYQKLFESKATIFVYTDETHTYLSPSCMTKEYFVSTIDKILEKQGEHNKCKLAQAACPACRLFGMVGDEGAVSSRVRITDTYEHKDTRFSENTKVLPILGNPRISATEFYLIAPKFTDKNGESHRAKMWNYDYYYKDYPEDANGNIIYNPIQYEPMLSGRKVYWHGKFDMNTVIVKTQMNCSVRPLEKGQFKFKVYFENVTDTELKNLLFALKLNNKGIHKIGKGKPIGMGDVKVSVESVNYRKYSYDGHSVMAYYDPDEEILKSALPDETGAAKDILTYTMPMNDREASIVGYPSVIPADSKIYEWFGGYRRPPQRRVPGNRGDTVLKPTIKHTLPLINEPKALEKF